MMSLNITVRLIDQLSQPSRRTAEALDKLASAARKLTNLPAATHGLKGLSTALRGFSNASSGGEATAGRVTRLANAVTGLAREADGIRQAATTTSGMDDTAVSDLLVEKTIVARRWPDAIGWEWKDESRQTGDGCAIQFFQHQSSPSYLFVTQIRQ